MIKIKHNDMNSLCLEGMWSIEIRLETFVMYKDGSRSICLDVNMVNIRKENYFFGEDIHKIVAFKYAFWLMINVMSRLLCSVLYII